MNETIPCRNPGESVVGALGGNDGGDEALWGILSEQNPSMSH